MNYFGYFTGTITAINDFFIENNQMSGCYKIMTVVDRRGNIVNFVITPSTYFVNHEMLKVGDLVVGFYDANAPVPLIYPPQYQAIVMAKLIYGQNIKVDYFNEQLISSDGMLKLNISPYTKIILENGQAFTHNIANHNLIVLYGPSTRSIPAITTPYKIIVICRAIKL